MADWIPMQVDLCRRSEVVTMAQMCNVSRYCMVGMLLEFWGWFTGESVDGHVDANVDAMVDATGLPMKFFNAMLTVKWVIPQEVGVNVVNWDRWLSQGAKSRMQKNLRQKVWRNGSKNVDGDVAQKAPLQYSTEHIDPPIVPQGGRSVRKSREEKLEETQAAAFKKDQARADRLQAEMKERLK